jgi:L-threonylcarbamoyladenylate synthase
MITDTIDAQDRSALKRALAVLQSGGLVAFPTDTVYGLGGLAFDRKAVESIYVVKDRPIEKAIPILIGDVEDLGKVCISVSEDALKLAARFWPGPLTLVILKNPGLPEAVSASSTVGVRIPDHNFARALLRLTGPLAVTSANLSGQSSPTTGKEVHAQLGGRIAIIIDGGMTPGGLPSTVVDCSGRKPKILRNGPITDLDILTVLDNPI